MSDLGAETAGPAPVLGHFGTFSGKTEIFKICVPARGAYPKVGREILKISIFSENVPK